MKLRPSSFPGLAQCPKFEPGPSDYTEAGTDRHRALADLFSGDRSLLEMLPEDDRLGVEWAAEYIRLHAPMSDYPIAFEVPVAFINNEFDEVPGTADCICGPELFDLKWRERDYSAQMAAYARSIMDAHSCPEITVHIMYAAFRRAERYKLTREAAVTITDRIIDAVLNDEANPNPCDYCSWCANKLTCGALIAGQEKITKGRWDWDLPNFHASEITQPAEMAKALKIARAIADWCEAVEHHAKEMVLKGITLPGFKLQERAGKSEVKDIAAAFSLCALDQAQFLSACQVQLTKLTEVYATVHGVSQAEAKRTIKAKLADHIEQRPSTYSLVAERSKK